MTVYVDELVEHPLARVKPEARLFGRRWCHLTADTPEELHAFAASLGLQRRWAQHEGLLTLHYDLTPSKRTLALARGAVFVPAMEQARRRIAIRRQRRDVSDAG